MFKTRCEQVGRNLRVIGGLPLLMGNPIRLVVGNDVTISGVTTIIGSKPIDNPILEIGSDSYIGYQVTIVTGRGVHIGQHVLIANRVYIVAAGNPARVVKELNPSEDSRNRVAEMVEANV